MKADKSARATDGELEVASIQAIEDLPESLSDRLKHLARLPHNWDSYGAAPISQNAIEKTKLILREILAVSGKDCPLPFIGPSPDGGVGLEWTVPSGKELILDIPPSEEPLTFLLVEPTDSGDEKETEGTIGDPYTLDGVIRRLLLR